MSHIGTRIKARRKELGLTQADLAARLGYKDKSTIAKIESGVNDITQSRAVQFADALDTTISYLIGPAEETEKAPSPISEEDAMLIEAFHNAGDKERRMIMYLLGLDEMGT